MITLEQLSTHIASGQLFETAAKNFLEAYHLTLPNSWQRAALQELWDEKQLTEINDRFYKTLSFGTGGLRGRTIGKYVTRAERGTPNELDRPEHACLGSNAMNDANVERAARGLCRYLKKIFRKHPSPSLVIAHDTRHFSRDFAQLVAQVATNEGINAWLFAEDRSTPQLSFTIRYLNAQAGVMITASHNPPYDNGFKAYFDDGAQLVEPHASAIIHEVNQIQATGELEPRYGATIQMLNPETDKAYLRALRTLVLDQETLETQASNLKIVYTPLHGTGAHAIVPTLKKYKIKPLLVRKQLSADGRFPTVASPNPENSEALTLAIKKAQKDKADIVIATDPDCDRMGVAIRNSQDDYELITGNQIGSILAYYRTTTLFQQGILTSQNATHACLIKTFVTTELQTAIAKKFGLKLVNTLTGFKYIGEKLRDYEQQLVEQGFNEKHYRSYSEEEKRNAHLKKGCYFVFGGEESYGYSGGDYVRDKDANAAALMFVEAAAHARSQNQTLLEYLDQIYSELGFFYEKLGQFLLEGAEGAVKIQGILKSFEQNPSKNYLGHAVVEKMNFAKENLVDVDGKPIPKELMLLFKLDNGAQIIVRGSGTEPKIKFYLSAHQLPPDRKSFTPETLLQAKQHVQQFIIQLWDAVQEDVHIRLQSLATNP
ncbi:MAG: phospho-sugar mutase [Verrucomicrobiae bacterium]|nr:phospho-sugar mutase [Verrucomicrobiae bacterium]